MAMKTKIFTLAACVVFFLPAPNARGQTITTEAAGSVGASTDSVEAGGVQLRAFGDLTAGVRYFGELGWAKSSDDDNDGFATAYPYGNRVQVIEAYAERIFQPDQALVSLRGGRYRTPFGISSASDQGYTGFLRPPLIRYEGYASLSSDYLEQGADFVVGVPRLTLETSLGTPGDVGAIVRPSGLDTTVRVQGSYGPFIGGVSYLRHHSIEAPDDPDFRATATGIDFRWMQSGVQVRGEWIKGQPVSDATNNGWYVDTLVHLVAMGPVTAVARVERLVVNDAGDEEASTRQTIGARIRLPAAFSVSVNVVHRGGAQAAEYPQAALDVGVTWSVRPHR
jgi:hypothetical protein